MLLRKILVLLLFISSFSFAKVKSVDIRALMELVKTESKANRDLIIIKTEANRDLIIANQKATDKRFEDLQRLIIANQKATDKRFEDMNKRFEDMRKYSDKRFENINKRFDNMITIMSFGFGLIVSMVGFFLVRVINQEKSVKELTNEVKVITNEVEKSSNKKYFEILVETIRTMAKKDDDFKIILRKYDLALVRN